MSYFHVRKSSNRSSYQNWIMLFMDGVCMVCCALIVKPLNDALFRVLSIKDVKLAILFSLSSVRTKLHHFEWYFTESFLTCIIKNQHLLMQNTSKMPTLPQEPQGTWNLQGFLEPAAYKFECNSCRHLWMSSWYFQNTACLKNNFFS